VFVGFMRAFFTSSWLLVFIVWLCGSAYSSAQGLVGAWKTETVRTAPEGTTNFFESYHTIEFLKDGTFKTGFTLFTAETNKQEVRMTGGRYSLVDTNHLRLELVPPKNSRLIVKFGLVGDELELSQLPDITAADIRFRRVK
jgi:hypothetical protein